MVSIGSISVCKRMIDFKKWAQSINGLPTELVRWTLHNLKRDQSLGALKHINVDMIEYVREHRTRRRSTPEDQTNLDTHTRLTRQVSFINYKLVIGN